MREQALKLAWRNAEKVDRLFKDRRAGGGRAQLHVYYNLHVALNCEQQHSQKIKKKIGEMTEFVKDQSAARLLNINGFIYM